MAASKTAGRSAGTHEPQHEAIRHQVRRLRIAKITDAAGNVSQWFYNLRGFLTSTSDPDAGVWTYEVNPFGEVTKIRDANTVSPAWTTEFTYDQLSRPTKRKDVPEAVETNWTWGKLTDNTATEKYVGQLKSISRGGYAEYYTFDALSRPTETRVEIDGSGYLFNRTYDAATGLLATLEYPAGITSARLKLGYEYSHNVLKRVKDANNASVTFWEAVSTDAFGNIKHEVFENGVQTLTTFNEASGWMEEREAGPGGSGLIHAQLTWDANGNLTTRKDLIPATDLVETLQYDGLNRLTKATIGTNVVDIGLDATGIGNIASKTGVGNYAYTGIQSGCNYYTHTQPHAVRKAGSVVYCYDANGNMVKRGSTNITYTSYNLPSSISAGGNSSTLSYGPFRNRYKQVAIEGSTTETTFYIGGLVEKMTRGGLTEYRHSIVGGNGLAAIYVHRSGGTPATETFYVHSDHLGSPELITDGSGAVRVKMSFGAYGERRDASDWVGAPSASDLTTIANTTRHGFTDHEQLDAVGLVHMNGRVFDPVIGRFTSADPIVRDAYSSQALNAYAYVEHRPLSFIDPSGLWPENTGPQPGDDLVFFDPVLYYFGSGHIHSGGRIGNPATPPAPPPLPPPSAHQQWDGGVMCEQPATVNVPVILPPVFYPGTIENQQFVDAVNAIILEVFGRPEKPIERTRAGTPPPPPPRDNSDETSDSDPNDDFCARRKVYCRAFCAINVLPTYDRFSQGVPFFVCFNQCMEDVGCTP